MTINPDVYLPEESELTVTEVPLGTPYLKAGSMHLGKVCEAVNNEFMLCRTEHNDPRKCLSEGKAVTSCSLQFFKQIKEFCAPEFNSYAMCLERSSSDFLFSPCRKTQAAFDSCMMDNLNIERPHYGYHCLPKIHETDRPKPVEQKPAWMDNPKANKLKELPANFPRDYQSWGGAGLQHNHRGEI